MNPTGTLAVMAVLAALPVGVLILYRAAEPPARRSLGRFFLLYSVLYSTLLMLARFIGQDVAWLLSGIVLGMLGAGRGVTTLYRYLYGRAWVSDHPEAPAADAHRWHLPTMIGAVGCIAVALFIAFFPR